ncbi:AaceriAFL119Cp [[Ashbya] aceris (nom. inval.)]|nr:AaceriAFL119Cp [[Ashbya] aceris (nom. inval.)]
MRGFFYVAVLLWLDAFVHAFLAKVSMDPICAVPPDRTLLARTMQVLLGIKRLPRRFHSFPDKFTGFRFHKSYRFNHRFFRARKTLKISYCQEGRLQFQIDHLLAKEIDWNIPFCILDAPVEQGKFWQQGSTNLNALNCFKLARRKKYAKRSFDIFLPDTWVGGLFHCNVTNDVKTKLVSLMDQDLNIRLDAEGGDDRFDITNVCTRENAIPLQPIMSSDYKQYWTNYKTQSRIPLVSQVYKMQVEKIIPFFETPVGVGAGRIKWGSPLDEQFASMADFWRQHSKTPWYEEIEVQENYNYNPTEEQDISTAHNITMTLLEPFLKYSRKLLTSFLDHDGVLRATAPERFKEMIDSLGALKRNVWHFLSTSDIVSSLGPEVHEVLSEIKRLWDDLNLVPEKFTYGEDLKKDITTVIKVYRSGP